MLNQTKENQTNENQMNFDEEKKSKIMRWLWLHGVTDLAETDAVSFLKFVENDLGYIDPKNL